MKRRLGDVGPMFEPEAPPAETIRKAGVLTLLLTSVHFQGGCSATSERDQAAGHSSNRAQ